MAEKFCCTLAAYKTPRLFSTKLKQEAHTTMHRSISRQTTTAYGFKGAKQGFAQCSRFNRLTPSFMTGINILKQKTSRLTAYVFSLLLYSKSCSCLSYVCNADRACQCLHTCANNIYVYVYFLFLICKSPHSRSHAGKLEVIVCL